MNLTYGQYYTEDHSLSGCVQWFAFTGIFKIVAAFSNVGKQL